LYAFLPGKSENVYKEFFDVVLRHITTHPTSVTIDFEAAVALIDDLASFLSRFLLFLVISQDSFAIPSMQDSCKKKQILTFL
jgi:hypothetical protein